MVGLTSFIFFKKVDFSPILFYISHKRRTDKIFIQKKTIVIFCVVALSVACVVVSKAEQAPAAFNVVSGITAREEYCLSAGGGKSVVGARMLSAADLSIAWRILFHASSLRCILLVARGL